MTGPTTIDVSFLTLPQRSLSALVGQWEDLEAVGASTIWVSDHLVAQQAPSDPWFSGWISLALLAQHTTAPRVGMLVSPPALHVPASLAKQIVTVDHLSGGRLDVGLGAGGSRRDGEWVARTEEARTASRSFAGFVEGLDELLRGTWHPDDEPPLAPPSIQGDRPPFTIAGRASTALELAVHHAARWNFYCSESSHDLDRGIEVAADLNRRIDAASTQAGRDPRTLTRSVLLHNGPLAVDRRDPHRAIGEVLERFGSAGIDEVIWFHPLDVHFPGEDVQELLATVVSR